MQKIKYGNVIMTLPNYEDSLAWQIIEFLIDESDCVDPSQSWTMTFEGAVEEELLQETTTSLFNISIKYLEGNQKELNSRCSDVRMFLTVIARYEGSNTVFSVRVLNKSIRILRYFRKREKKNYYPEIGKIIDEERETLWRDDFLLPKEDKQ